ncbi:MAG: TetR family transcriptional regulator [bacterium]|nr:MAG: TetR family transcriptional regulator [bacterium]
MNAKDKDIIRKVAQLYSKYGIKSITMDDVAHELGISKKTLYEYFSDKLHLVNAVIEQEILFNDLRLKEQKSNSENALQEMFKIFRFHLQMLKEYNPALEFDLKKYYPEIYSRLKRIKRTKIWETTLNNLIKGKREGFYRKELNEEIITKLTVLRIESLSENDLFSQEEIYSHEFSKEMFLYHLHGILTPMGIEYLNKNLEQLNLTK